MKVSALNLNTLKEDPAEAEIVSHKLMLRTGMIRRLTSGIFTWMPIGLRVVRKVEAIVREEMNAIGALELLMPSVQPAELWRETGRWDKYGPLLLRRDEIRPRFGVMRAREFIMKDAYSFGRNADDLSASYDAMARAYTRAFERMGLEFRKVDADSGEIGGSRSQEFHVLADSGEDAIAFCPADDYAANVEMTPAPPMGEPDPPGAVMQRVETPGVKTIEQACDALGTRPDGIAKTLIVAGDDGPVALVLRGDHELNAVKAAKLAGVAEPLTMAEPGDVVKATGAPPGSVGPVGLDIPLYVDHAAAALSDFACGANEKGVHLVGVNWGRDLPAPEPVDLRNVVAGDPSPTGAGPLEIARGIEVGHIFQLGTQYSEAMGATVQDEDGQPLTMTMGCYGIGITRIVAAAIEQNHDAAGIIWPEPLAPWSVILVPINAHRSDAVREAADALYADLLAAGVEVLLDDRDARPGAKFADAELLGIPHRITIGDRGLASGDFEYRHRRAEASEMLKRDVVLRRVGAA